jgi:putative SOS response-associated peptidase YedK
MPKQAMFNARIETVETSAAFKDAFASTRCLIPADGFFEWTRSPVAGATPWHIFLPEYRLACGQADLSARTRRRRAQPPCARRSWNSR